MQIAPARAVALQSARVKIATFNVNSIRSRLETLLGWCRAHQPDVVCVQETKVQDHEFPQAPIMAAGYQVAFKGEKAYNGVAILARTGLTDIRFGFDDGGPRDETRLVCARVGDLHVVNTYVPQGRELNHAMYQYKLEWFARLRRYFEQRFRPQDLLVWTGDLNVAAEPIDVHAPEEYGGHVCFHVAVREAFAACRAWGFTDAFRQFHPEGGQYSFFDYRTPNGVKRKLGWRLDYILASPPLAARARDAGIDLAPRLASKASDHTVAWAVFDL